MDIFFRGNRGWAPQEDRLSKGRFSALIILVVHAFYTEKTLLLKQPPSDGFCMHHVCGFYITRAVGDSQCTACE